MNNAEAYLPHDRRQVLAAGQELPERTQGAALFADLSGFTPLADALVRSYGTRRGADELPRHLNNVYGALIDQVQCYGGVVIGFSGDAITCWFDAGYGSTNAVAVVTDPAMQTVHSNNLDAAIVAAIRRAVTSALAMQEAMKRFHTLELPQGDRVTLALKTAIAAGKVRRFVVGDPQRQWLDVLAGATVDQMAAAEQMAEKGQLLLAASAALPIQDELIIAQWRTQATTGHQFALVTAITVPSTPQTSNPLAPLTETQVKPWVLPAVYARLQNEQGRFLAELRPATALFLKFDGLDYDQDEAAPAKLNAYIRWVQAVLARYEGVLIQLTTGDKGSYLYAAFGAPIAHDDDTQRAVVAALDLRMPPPHCPFITKVQIGVSQGMMRVGPYGSATRRTYGVLGDEVMVAARLMSKAEPGQVLVSQVVSQQLAHAYQVQPLGMIQLKGKPAPQPVFAVLQRWLPGDSRIGQIYSSPLVGRELQLAQMNVCLTRALGGQGQILRLEGSAGIGKSHLVAHFARQAAGQRLAVAVGASQSTSQDAAYSALRQVARTLLGLDTFDLQQHEAQISQVERTLQQMNPEWLVRMPLLGDLLGLAIADNAVTAAFDPKLRQEALASLALEIVQTRARQRPLLLIFEDIHWMDEASQGLLLALGRVITAAPTLLLLIHRPPLREQEPFLQEVAALPHQTYIKLDELSPEGIAALVENRLGGQVASIALSLIQAQTQGNPFFTEELLAALVDSGQLVQEQGKWTLATRLIEQLRAAGCLERVEGEELMARNAPLNAVDLGIPNTIQGIILSRLDRLPEATQLTLKVASVIGRVFAFDLLAHAHPTPAAALILPAQIETLLERDFARLETAEPTPIYIFKHNITQEVVYQTLVEEQRHELHRAVGQAIEAAHPEQIEALAFHFYNSNIQENLIQMKALRYLEAAGMRAKRDDANETALSYFERALGLEVRWPWLKAKIQLLHILGRRIEEEATLKRLADLTETPQFDISLLWADYCEAISKYPQAMEAVASALQQANDAGQPEGQARCYARIGMIAWRQGDYAAAEVAYRQALHTLQNLGQPTDDEAETRYGLGLVYRQQGKYDEAQAEFNQALTINQQMGNRQAEAKSLNALGGVAHLRRNFHEAVTYYRSAFMLRQEIGDRAGVGSSLFNLAQSLGSLGDHNEAERMLYEALRIQQALNDRWWETNTWNELGILYLMVGNLAQAQQCLEEGLQLSQTIGHEAIHAYLLCNLGQVLRDTGQTAQAEQTLVQALQLAQARNDIHLEAICLSDLALVSLQQGLFSDAVKRASLSLDKFTGLAMRLSSTSDLAILAAAHGALGNSQSAIEMAKETLQILDGCDGEGPDFPHRDYWMCHQALALVGETSLAQQALRSAHQLLMRQAARIKDPAMRASYLENVSFNRQILQAVDQSLSGLSSLTGVVHNNIV